MAQANAKKEEYDTRGGVSADADAEIDDATGDRTPKSAHGRQSRRAYLRELRKVIDASDVILQVLDARDPMGTRMGRSAEEAILSRHDKRMVLVLNKIDLVPKDAVSGWLVHLRRSHPTVAMKAGTNQSRSAEVGRTEGDSALKSSSGVGVEGLLQLLKNYARTGGGGGGSKSCVTVGIVGYPNVGKSSILNTLKRSRAVGVSPRPGFTTSMQEVVLDRSVRLVDSPGVVFDDGEDDNADNAGSHSLLRNCVDADAVDDPIPAVSGLLSRCDPRSLVMTYEIPAFPPGDVMTFLGLVARRSGRVLRGGVPDKVRAARQVIRDWNSGKIMYYAPPPDDEMSDTTDSASGGGGGAAADGKGAASIVSSFGEAFDVDKMAELDRAAMEGLPQDGMDFVELAPPAERDGGAQTAKFLRDGSDSDDDDDAMEEDGAAEATVSASASASSKRRKSEGKRSTRGRGAKKSATSNDAVAEAEDYDFDDL